MFVYSVSNSFIDRIDPYWYSRLTGLKLAYIAVILFFINGFFKSPTFPVLYMLVTAAGAVVTELPPINSPKKKILAYIGVVILCITTNSIFGLVSYLKWGLLIGVGIWALILYRLLAKNAKSANLVGVLLLVGIVSIQGDVATDLNGVINHALFYLEFASVGLIALILFPNFRDRVVKSAALRLLETDVALLNKQISQSEFDERILGALLCIHNEAEQAPKAFYELLPLLKTLQVLVRGCDTYPSQQSLLILTTLQQFHQAIRLTQPINLDLTKLNDAQYFEPQLAGVLKQFAQAWNAQCLT